MRFNALKSSLVLFGDNSRPSEFSYFLGDTLIPTAKSFKYLGVHISNTHVDSSVVNRANRILGLIRHTLWSAPREVRILSYKTLCRPLIEYASEAWDPCTKVLISKLETVQNKALRFILNLKLRT
jgi:hypothetical protein